MAKRLKVSNEAWEQLEAEARRRGLTVPELVRRAVNIDHHLRERREKGARTLIEENGRIHELEIA